MPVRTGRYFAAFQAAIAALADKGVQNRKNDHAWVQSEFNRRLIKNRKVYPDKMKTYLLNMQEVRNHADYSVEKIGKNLARRQLGRADEMVESIEKELGK
ncbi:MAG: hypothetical protein HC887_05370 [Desulfobacteraceae bacterium]|nr:hypothetical protein [Desulfobacteraceae bacterium]